MRADRLGDRPDDPIDERRRPTGLISPRPTTRRGCLTDARLTAVLPADGDYVVELSDSRYQGGGRPVYRLVIGAVPMAEEIYPLGGRAGRDHGAGAARRDA